MRIFIYRNTSDRRFGKAAVPYRQTCLWIGPVFVLIQRGHR